MSAKTILVTGGAGFIGSNFARRLYTKYPDYRLLVVDALTYAGSVANLPEGAQESGRYEFWYGDVRNGELMDTLVSRADIVVHMAAESHVTRSIYDNRLFFETDVLGTQTVANAVTKFRDRVERFIHVSTSEVYGSALAEEMDEEHPLNPQSPYASAKCGADRLVYSYWATYHIPATIVRPFNNFGPYQHLEKVVPRFITSVLLNEELTVHGEDEMGYLATSFDDMRRRQRTYVRSLQEVARAKSEFIAVASHELRTPISIIRGWEDLLRGEFVKPGTPSYAEGLDAIGRACQSLEKIAVSATRMAQSDGKEGPPAPAPCAVEPLLTDAVREASSVAPERQVSLTIDVQPEAQQAILDRGQVLHALDA